MPATSCMVNAVNTVNTVNMVTRRIHSSRLRLAAAIVMVAWAAGLGRGQASGLPLAIATDSLGQASVAIYDGGGRMVRTLAYGEPWAAGTRTLLWDGLDRYGHAQPPGDYEWRLLLTPGFTARHLGRVGTQPPPGQPAAQWIANHGGPRVVAVADGYLFAGAATEGGPELVCRSLDNQYQAWGIPGDKAVEHSTPVGLATDGFELFWLQDNAPRVLVMDVSFPDPLRRLRRIELVKDAEPGSWGRGLDHGFSLAVAPPPAWSDLVRLAWDGESPPVPDGSTRVEFPAAKWRHAPGTAAQGHVLQAVPVGEAPATIALADDCFLGVAACLNALAAGDYLLPLAFDLAAGHAVSMQVTLTRADGDLAARLQRLLGLYAPALSPPDNFPPTETRTLGSVTGEMRPDVFVPLKAYLPFTVVAPGNGTAPQAGQFAAGAAGGLGMTVSSAGPLAFDNLRVGRPIPLDLARRSLVVGDRDRNAVRWLDKFSGELLAEAAVPAPLAVCADEQGHAYVLSEGMVVRLSPDGAAPATVIVAAEQLAAPRSLAYEAQNRHLLLVDGNQVRRFDLAGHHVRDYGRPEGRAFGRFEPTDFAELRAVAADGEGGFVTVEGQRRLRRTAHVDAKGQVRQQWFGGQAWGMALAVDPQGGRRVATPAGYPGTAEAPCSLLIYDLDYATGKATLRGECAYYPFLDGLFPAITSTTGQWQWRRRGDRSFLVSFGQGLGGSRGPLAVLALDDDECSVSPAALLGTANAGQPIIRDALIAQDFQPEEAVGWLYAWTDANGDGVAQPDEFVFAATPNGAGVGGVHRLDDDWNVVAGFPALTRIPDVAPSASPLPRWDLVGTTVTPLDVSDGWKNKPWRGVGGSTGLEMDSAGNVYQMVFGDRGHYTDNQPVTGRKLMDAMFGSLRLMSWSADGRLRWEMGYKQGLSRFQVRFPQTLIGRHRECIVLHDRVANPARVVTDDGLYAGSFLDHLDPEGLTPFEAFALFRCANGRGRPLSQDQMHGAMVALGPDEVIWFRMGLMDTLFYRITGWEGWQRKSGKITLAEPPKAARRQGTGLMGHYFNHPEFGQATPGDGKADELLGDLLAAPAVPRTRLDRLIWFFVGGENIHGANFAGKAPRGVPVWGARSPWPPEGPDAPGIIPDHFSARWTGYLEAPLSEEFRFIVRANREATTRLWIDGREINYPETIALQAGELYPIRLDYSEGGSQVAELQLSWESLSLERQVVPTEFLYPEPPDAGSGD